MMQTPKPRVSIAILGGIVLMCALAPLISGGEPMRMELAALRLPPGIHHIFGTDPLGRDIFNMIIHGGRASLLIGLFASLIAGMIAAVYGTVAGLAPRWLDDLLMRITELIMSVPSILYIISLSAIFGRPTLMSLSIIIGVTSWTSISKIVRAEVRQIRQSEYILSARLSGGGFIYILRRHLFPNFIPAIMFMLIYNISQAIATEATLSFLGLGLPPNTASWGSLMALAQDALLTNDWWIILIPTTFLVVTLVCITNIGEYLRTRQV
ncbi:MAG: ABC transporter permease [Clostridiales Family XIII bacterium]|nr:ABC transporter permease [Clostridiales Family XIII bacterium]